MAQRMKSPNDKPLIRGHDQLVTKLLTGGSLTGTKTNWIFTN